MFLFLIINQVVYVKAIQNLARETKFPPSKEYNIQCTPWKAPRRSHFLPMSISLILILKANYGFRFFHSNCRFHQVADCFGNSFPLHLGNLWGRKMELQNSQYQLQSMAIRVILLLSCCLVICSNVNGMSFTSLEGWISHNH